jgi:NADPH:quinone reductase-like Zn-dependent oxidoreductase
MYRLSGHTECRELLSCKGGDGGRDADRKTLEFMAKAVRDGELVIPISRKLPLSKAGEAQVAAEEGGIGKVLLVA